MVLTKSRRKTPTPENDFIRSIIRDFRLLLSKNRTNYAYNIIHIQKILSFFRDIFKNDSNAQVFTYFCLYGAATAWILQNELGMPETTVYRVLKLLRSKKIVVPAIRIAKTKNSKGGSRPTIWAIEGACKEISRAIKLHYRRMSPKFRLAEEVAQTILDEYIAPRKVDEISYKEIVVKVRELRIPFRTSDIADLVARYLHEKGLRVWR